MRRLYLLLLIAILVLAACGGDDKDEDSGSDSENGDSSLGESYRNDDFSVRYPEDWLVLDKGDDNVMLINKRSVYDQLDNGVEFDTLESGTVIVQIDSTGLDGEDDLRSLIYAVKDSLGGEQDEVVFEGDNLAYFQLHYDVGEGYWESDVLVVLVQQGDTISGAIGYVPPGQMDSQTRTMITDIAKSIRLRS